MIANIPIRLNERITLKYFCFVKQGFRAESFTVRLDLYTFSKILGLGKNVST